MKIKLDPRKIYLSLFLFLFIFMPPIIPKINILYLLDLISFFLLFTEYKDDMLAVLRIKSIKRFNEAYWIFVLCTIIHMFYDFAFVNKLDLIDYMISLYKLIGVGILIQIVVIYCVCYCNKNKLSIEDLIQCIICAGLIQATITIFTLLSPSLKLFLYRIFINNVYGSEVQFARWMYSERFFGFARVLFDGFGYGTGIIAGLVFLRLFEKHKIKDVFQFSVLLLVPAVNAITGVVIALFSGIIILVNFLSNKKIKILSIIYFVGVFAIGILGMIMLKEKAAMSFRRLWANILAILGDYKGTTSFSNLMRKSYWILPTKVTNVLFGTGHSVYQIKNYTHSDVGYINMIWLSGIIGSAWLYGSFIALALNVKKCSINTLQKNISIFCIFAFLLFEAKGIGIAINTGIPIIMLIYYAILFENCCDKTDKKLLYI